MTAGFTNPDPRRFTAITPVSYGVAGGVAGWVDTDVSGTTGLSTGRTWLIFCVNEGFGVVGLGIRAHGEPTDTHSDQGLFSTFSKVDAAGHVDLYRHLATSANYLFLGYWE